MHVRPRRLRVPTGCLLLTFLFGPGLRVSAAPDGPNRPRQTPLPTRSAVDVLTYHNDNARTGRNLKETVLQPANVRSDRFGKVGFLATDGQVYAQPLLLSDLPVAGALREVLFVATEHDSVYAFDVTSGAKLWKTSLLGPGETPSDDRGCGQIEPEIGVTATPVIDRGIGPHGTLFVVAMSMDHSGDHVQRLHALDVATGAEQPGSPGTIRAQYPGHGRNSVNGRLVFDPAQVKERSGLLLLNGVIYTTWASHCDHPPYNAWVIAYDARTLRQTAVLNLTPNGTEGGLWGAGAAPAADAAGDIYLMTGNGTFDVTLDARGFPRDHDYGNALLKLSTAGRRLEVADYFTMKNTIWESSVDWDLGSGGVLLLPAARDNAGRVRHLAVGAGKDQTIYVVDRDHLGGFHPDRDDAYQELAHALAGQEYGMPAYFDGTVYYGAMADALRAYPVVAARLSARPSSRTRNIFTFPGATPSISADGNVGGIVWAVDLRDPAVLRAYDATDLSHELYDSDQAPGGRDRFGTGIKFSVPTIANGRVYVGTTRGVAVFGLLR